MDFDLKDFRYIVMGGKNVPSEVKTEHEQAFLSWQNTWKLAYQEMGDPKVIFSDNFTRNTEVGALFYKDECAALTCFQRMNFNEATARSDSFFQYWSDANIVELCKDGKNVLMCQGLAVAKQFRGEIAPEVRLKVLIIELSAKYLLKTRFDVMAGAMRKERGTHKSAYMAGATLIAPSVGPYKWELDVVGFYRKTLMSDSTKLSNFWLETIWSRHQDFTGLNENAEKTKAA